MMTRLNAFASEEECIKVSTQLGLLPGCAEERLVTMYCMSHSWTLPEPLLVEDLIEGLSFGLVNTVDGNFQKFKIFVATLDDMPAYDVGVYFAKNQEDSSFKEKFTVFCQVMRSISTGLLNLDQYAFEDMFYNLCEALTDYMRNFDEREGYIVPSDMKNLASYLGLSEDVIDIDRVVKALKDDALIDNKNTSNKNPNMAANNPENFLATLVSLANKNSPSSKSGIKSRFAPNGPTAPVEEPVMDATAVRIYDPQAVMKHLESLPAPEFGESNKPRRVLADLAAKSGMRKMSQVADVTVLDVLYQKFPHFSPVVDFVKESLAAMSCGEQGAPAKIPPILLRGVPGTGKTYFAQELARLLGTHFVTKDLSLTSEAFVLTGMDPVWKGAKSGVIFDTLINTDYANPLILLDEVDKCRETGHHASPMTALHALLEPTTATAFQDEFLPIKLDASNVIWVLTANAGHIPEPVLSRLEVFDIAYPTPDQCEQIAQSIWESICEKQLPKGHPFANQLPEDIRAYVRNVSPRNMRKALTRASGMAAVKKSKELSLNDLKVALAKYEGTSKSAMGFIQA